MTTPVIGSATVSPQTARPGESVKIEVRGPSGESYEDKDDVTILIDGAPGPVQFQQFSGAGERKVLIQAWDNQHSEQSYATVTISGDPLTINLSGGPANTQLALLYARRSMRCPYEVSLSLGMLSKQAPIASFLNAESTAAMANAAAAALLAAKQAQTGGAVGVIRDDTPVMVAKAPGVHSTPRKTVSTRSGVMRVKGVIATLGSFGASKGIRVKPPEAAGTTGYEWDFGDGTQVITTVPSVTHDYFPAVAAAAPNRATRAFHVRCRVIRLGATTVEVVRTLVLHSAYAICKQTGYIVPHTTSGIYAEKQFGFFAAQMTMHNVEEVPLTLTHRAIVPLDDDTDAVVPLPQFEALTTPISLAPRAATALFIKAPMHNTPASTAQSLAYNVPGFTVYFAGQAQGGTPVRISRVFELPVAIQGSKPSIPPPPQYKRKPEWEIYEKAMREIISRPGDPGDRVARSRDVQFDRATGTLAVKLAGGVERFRAIAGRGVQRVLFTVLNASMVAASLAVAGTAPTRTLGGSRTPPNFFARVLAGIRRLAGAIVTLGGRLALWGILLLFATTGGDDGPPEPGPVAAGQICDPDNIPSADQNAADAQQLVCQLSGEHKDVLMPARFMNARKGDIVLSPGGVGLIGSLLRAVSPPQRYSHSGIMTRNYDEVTHSTASETRLKGHLAGTAIDGTPGTEGLDPLALKYMWPGIVTQKVEAAVIGEKWKDPEGILVNPFTGEQHQETYSISSFSPHAVGATFHGAFEVVPPFVVKPDPLKETAAVRQRLREVAEDARSMGGRVDKDGNAVAPPKGHYRLYCYTDPTIGQTTQAPAEASWAAGTIPTVCSAFIWLILKKHNVHLEADTAYVMPSDLEATDIAQGAEIRPGTPDGLYMYTADERRAAGQWLYDAIHHQVLDKAGWFANFWSDAADDAANQICNTFASDDAEGKDSDDWQSTGAADAVSPDNILSWDSPDKNGLYGFAEPLQYRERRTEPYMLSRWKKVLHWGTIAGTVTLKGTPVAGAEVHIYEGQNAITDGNGKFDLAHVGLGSYLLKAQKAIDGVLYSVQQLVTLNADQIFVTLELQPPADRFRLLQIFVDFWGSDDEWGFWDDDEIHDPGPQYFELELGPDKPTNGLDLPAYKWGGEMRVEYTITAVLAIDNSIEVIIQGSLYEGTDEENDDLDGTGTLKVSVPKDETVKGKLTITNTDEDVSDDRGELTLTLKNAPNTN